MIVVIVIKHKMPKKTTNTSIICMRQQKPTKYCCRKCNYVWFEPDPKIIKVWCPNCKLIMKKQ